jgi:hypothetical protein
MRCREWQRSHVLPDIRLRRSQPARARPRRDSGRTRDYGECDPGPTAVALAYIHEARGEQKLADRSWDRLLASDSQAKAGPIDTNVVERSGSE